MGTAVDTILLRLADAVGVHDVVFPSADPGRTRIRTLISAVYALPYAAIRDVTAVDVRAVECAQPLFPIVRRTGNWTQTMPSHIRTDLDILGSDGTAPRWIDVVADLSVTVVLEIDPGELDTFRAAELENFTTLDEFRGRFRYLDLDAFMREHQLHTVDDLRRAYRYLLAEVKLKPAPAFDPADPSNTRRLALRVGILIRDTLAVTDALRDVRELSAAHGPVVDEHTDRDFAEATAAVAPLVVFPESSVAGSGFSKEQVVTFFAGRQILAVFV